MKRIQINGVRSILAAVALSAFAVVTSCAGHVVVGYRSYDPYYTDYHVWGPPEFGYYQQWELETHRPHRDFLRRRKADRREYWNWRHQHGAPHPEERRR